MSKKLLSRIATLYTVIVLGGFFIYAYTIQEDGIIDTQKYFNQILTFVVLGLIGLVIAGISGASLREEGKKVSKKSVYVGLSIAAFFLLWRLSMSLL
ncbi:hypothetical protein EVU96_24365 [Bacillus infantis]|uniref:hypothetical protein n=1 Tax=Bacillus infantis TaxID=324767 RepID=UPI00101BCB18|nr:hypothetical protein [Bacillus infantis]MCK6208639.1 hypothetical protein [Bacillus infantis]RYI25284.1 hypothetical protein EVU96_24365 [Bacillus infantis]